MIDYLSVHAGKQEVAPNAKLLYSLLTPDEKWLLGMRCVSDLALRQKSHESTILSLMTESDFANPVLSPGYYPFKEGGDKDGGLWRRLFLVGDAIASSLFRSSQPRA